MKEPTCRSCQRCCWIRSSLGFGLCKYIKDGKCSIYETRIGTEIETGQYCGYRKDSKYDYLGCPYNTDKPILRIGG